MGFGPFKGSTTNPWGDVTDQPRVVDAGSKKAGKTYSQDTGAGTTQEIYRETDPGSMANALLDKDSADSRAFRYRNDPNAAEKDIARARELGEQASRTPLEGVGYENADNDRTLGMLARGNADEARGMQAEAAGMYKDAAMGNAPSVAQAQFAQALGAQRRQAASMAASARGGGLARAAAQRQAMNVSADMGQNSAAASAALRAQEIENARAGYAGASNQLRSGDMATRAQDLAQQKQDADQDISRVQLNYQGKALNNDMRKFYETQALGVENMDMNGRMGASAAERDLMNIRLGQQRDAQAAQQYQDSRGDNYLMGFLNMFKSDKRAKEDIHPADGKVRSFLDALKAADYEYKNPARDGAGRHAGVMAQDLEKSELGRRMVHDTPEGKMVDYREGFATMLASQASLNDRMSGIEKALQAKLGKKAA